MWKKNSMAAMLGPRGHSYMDTTLGAEVSTGMYIYKVCLWVQCVYVSVHTCICGCMCICAYMFVCMHEYLHAVYTYDMCRCILYSVHACI